VVYCLDTNTCIDAMKGKHEGLSAEFAARTPADITVPAIVRAELLHGAARSARPQRTKTIVVKFLAPYATISFDNVAAEHYAAIRFELENRGEIIGPNDLIIAATARSRGFTLVTHNTREFRRVSGLTVEDWVPSE